MGDAAAIAALSADALDRRLDATATSPLAVAFSGGGDSLALLIGVCAWARRAGRPVLALTVDHRLQADSARWARWCAALSAALGASHRILVWEGAKPDSGLAAAARAARHQCLADAARAAGASVILMGHTLDDRLEARIMRSAGGSVAEPREWSPSPMWPAGRGQFILRPLIGVRRDIIRRWLAEGGETWIEDPANADPRHPRVRARRRLADGETVPSFAEIPDLAPLLAHARVTEIGEIVLEPEAFPLLGPALLCAAGSDRPPRGERLRRLADRLRAGEAFTATLAGARLDSDDARARVTREAGEFLRAGAEPSRLDPFGASIVWDGRFEVVANAPGLSIAPLAGHVARLDPAQVAAIKGLRPAVRKSLPAIIDARGRVDLPTVRTRPDLRVTLRNLVAARFSAACGAIASESALAFAPALGEDRPPKLRRTIGASADRRSAGERVGPDQAGGQRTEVLA